VVTELPSCGKHAARGGAAALHLPCVRLPRYVLRCRLRVRQLGVACFPVDTESPEALLEKADDAMYHSKKTGRNGVSFFGVDMALVRADGATEERTADRRRE
jgi:predicted signal transduction protein with EAL and GGDEF domain